MSTPANGLRFQTVSFLSDFGLSDEFVGVVHSVIRSIAPDVRVIDITHDVSPHNFRAGGLALARAVPYMAPGIALAVVDPGVGTDRKAVAVEVADGGAFLIGPDNGLLAPATALVGGATGAVVLDNPEYHLPGTGQNGSTFDGRDVFAPAAAHLCLGVPMHELGSVIDPSMLMPALLPAGQVESDGSVTSEILWVDRFGNCQLNLEPELLASWPETVSIEGGRLTRNANRVNAYGEIPTGAFGLLPDSAGLLAIAVDRGSASFELNLNEGDQVILRPVEGPTSNVSPVTLTTKKDRPSRERPVGEPGSLE